MAKERENRDKKFSLRLSSQEYSYLKKKIKKTPLNDSEFIRRLIFGEAERIPNKKDVSLLEYVMFGMSQANNNINQIARALNGMMRSGDYRMGSQTQRSIEDLNRIIQEWNEFSRKIVK